MCVALMLELGGKCGEIVISIERGELYVELCLSFCSGKKLAVSKLEYWSACWNLEAFTLFFPCLFMLCKFLMECNALVFGKSNGDSSLCFFSFREKNSASIPKVSL